MTTKDGKREKCPESAFFFETETKERSPWWQEREREREGERDKQIKDAHMGIVRQRKRMRKNTRAKTATRRESDTQADKMMDRQEEEQTRKRTDKKTDTQDTKVGDRAPGETERLGT